MLIPQKQKPETATGSRKQGRAGGGGGGAAPTLHNTCKHMLGTHASFPGIPTIWGSFSSETLNRGTGGSTLVAFSVGGLTNGVFYLFWFV